VRIRQFIAMQPAALRWSTYVVSLLLLVLLGDFVSEQQFIYFQF
jgi:hypothetical protein